jgi:hypothetical protein
MAYANYVSLYADRLSGIPEHLKSIAAAPLNAIKKHAHRIPPYYSVLLIPGIALIPAAPFLFLPSDVALIPFVPLLQASTYSTIKIIDIVDKSVGESRQ